jgi:glutathione S-transferase
MDPVPTTGFILSDWPGLPGRGEPIRLAFEETGTTYEDVAYTRGVDAVTALFRPKEGSYLGNAFPHFAPPILKHGDLTISQLPNIMYYLGTKLGLAPEDEGKRARVNQLFLTIAEYGT